MDENRNHIELRLESVLWRTAGHDWDYEFIAVPQRIPMSSWYQFHRQVFANLAPSDEERNLYGTLMAPASSPSPFVGTAFLDPMRRDVLDRRIAHFIVWFFEKDVGSSARERIPISWGPQLIFQLESHVSVFFQQLTAPTPNVVLGQVGPAPLQIEVSEATLTLFDDPNTNSIGEIR